jgi:hypothetical protein
MVAIVANSGARSHLMIFALPLVFGIGKNEVSGGDLSSLPQRDLEQEHSWF